MLHWLPLGSSMLEGGKGGAGKFTADGFGSPEFEVDWDGKSALSGTIAAGWSAADVTANKTQH